MASRDEETVSLREYFEALLVERDRLYSERLTAQQTESHKAASDLEARLDLLNELRGNVLTRAEYDARHEQLESQIARLRDETTTLREELAKKLSSDLARGRVMGTSIALAGATSGFVFIIVALLTHGFK